MSARKLNSNHRKTNFVFRDLHKCWKTTFPTDFCCCYSSFKQEPSLTVPSTAEISCCAVSVCRLLSRFVWLPKVLDMAHGSQTGLIFIKVVFTMIVIIRFCAL